ncbi:protein FATTY ACID EXPORT 3, chloroplastic isoform X1 [Typha latifolia]|uniref:protein FATTY ACID EXPORT 3, chloroplastic isoform X1 n=1 Tax=Typha latifolia TaxID=4733 RepID=UPI003C2ED2AE
MAASLQSFVHLRNPSPTLIPNLHGRGATCLSFSTFFHLEAAPRRLVLVQSPLSKKGPIVSFDRRQSSRLVALAASGEESIDSDLDVEKENKRVEIKQEDSREGLKQSLEHFKGEALKVKAMSQEVYEEYSKKAMEVLMETSEKLKIQADKAQKDLNVIAKEVSEEGLQYLDEATKNSPDAVKDIVETFRSLRAVRKVSDIHDYHIGIPYGSLLALGGFLQFMLTGSIPAIRFGVILGTALLALGVVNLRYWRSGNASSLLLKWQTAIAVIIFFRELFSQGGFYSNLFGTLISGAMVGLYVYQILISGHSKGQGFQQRSEN